MIRFLSLLLSFCLLTIFTIGCSQNKEDNLSELTGYIGEKRNSNSNQILVIPNIDKETLMKSSKEEIINKAIENQGIYFKVDSKVYKQLQKGNKVVVYYDSKEGQEDSNPPQLMSQKVEIIEK